MIDPDGEEAAPEKDGTGEAAEPTAAWMPAPAASDEGPAPDEDEPGEAATGGNDGAAEPAAAWMPAQTGTHEEAPPAEPQESWPASGAWAASGSWTPTGAWSPMATTDEAPRTEWWGRARDVPETIERDNGPTDGISGDDLVEPDFAPPEPGGEAADEAGAGSPLADDADPPTPPDLDALATADPSASLDALRRLVSEWPTVSRLDTEAVHETGGDGEADERTMAAEALPEPEDTEAGRPSPLSELQAWAEAASEERGPGAALGSPAEVAPLPAPDPVELAAADRLPPARDPVTEPGPMVEIDRFPPPPLELEPQSAASDISDDRAAPDAAAGAAPGEPHDALALGRIAPVEPAALPPITIDALPPLFERTAPLATTPEPVPGAPLSATERTPPALESMTLDDLGPGRRGALRVVPPLAVEDDEGHTTAAGTVERMTAARRTRAAVTLVIDVFVGGVTIAAAIAIAMGVVYVGLRQAFGG